MQNSPDLSFRCVVFWCDVVTIWILSVVVSQNWFWLFVFANIPALPYLNLLFHFDIETFSLSLPLPLSLSLSLPYTRTHYILSSNCVHLLPCTKCFQNVLTRKLFFQHWFDIPTLFHCIEFRFIYLFFLLENMHEHFLMCDDGVDDDCDDTREKSIASFQIKIDFLGGANECVTSIYSLDCVSV